MSWSTSWSFTHLREKGMKKGGLLQTISVIRMWLSRRVRWCCMRGGKQGFELFGLEFEVYAIEYCRGPRRESLHFSEVLLL